MDQIVVSLKDVSKRFRRYHRPVDRLKEQLFPGKSRAIDFWALRDINLEISRGETLGIIGRNGAGKSTLLQLIAGILLPSSGNVKVNGRVSALLELGSGFNPEFTGRQNVFFNGRLLGLTQKEIKTGFDDIVEFANIGDFLDQPVKTYSSGMMMRLAFSVAVSSHPDVLIVDEALAVGDVYFQQKCFERIRQLQAQGTTLLFVSHDTGSVYNLCQSAVLLENGNMILKSTPKQVIDLYEAKMIKETDTNSESLNIQNASPELANPVVEIKEQSVSVGSSEVKIEFVDFYNDEGGKVDSIISGQFVQLSVGVRFLHKFDDPVVGFKIRDRRGDTIFVNHTYDLNQPIGTVGKNSLVDVRFRFRAIFSEGQYTVTIGVADSGFGEGQFERSLAYANDTAALTVMRDKDSRWGGIVNLEPQVAIHR